jgi:BRO family, N-terminal domain
LQILIKLAVIGAVMGAVSYKGGGPEIALAAVLLAPVIGAMFARDVMSLFGGSAYALRKHAFDSDARVFKYGYTQIRMIMYRNRAWFEAAPVCAALGVRDTERSIRHYATTEYCVRGTKKEPFLSESGVRRMAEISRHAEAPAFLRWFDKEVLTTLEKSRRRMKTQADQAVDIDVTHPQGPDTPDRPAA